MNTNENTRAIMSNQYGEDFESNTSGITNSKHIPGNGGDQSEKKNREEFHGRGMCCCCERLVL
jgi:hypothetical protein